MNYSRTVSKGAIELHHDAIIIDTLTNFCESYNDSLAQSGITATNVTMANSMSDNIEGTVMDIADHYIDIRSDPKLRLIESVDDIYQVKEDGYVGIIASLQNAQPMAYNLAMVEVFYRLGIRVSTLTYNERNFAGDGVSTGSNAGLSREGRDLVKEMNRIGIVLDLSHVGDRSSMEAIEISEKPPIYSHSNPRSRCNMTRNITDDHMRAVAKKGGVIGLTTLVKMNWDGGPTMPTLDDFLENVEFVIDLVGIDHVSIGTDSLFTPGAFPRAMARKLGKYSDTFAGYEEVFQYDFGVGGYLNGFRGIEDFPVITQGLIDRGYDEKSIRKVLGLNIIRVYKEVW